MTKTLDIFISSKMAELKAERDVLYDLIPSLNYGDIQLRAWVFENDAPASNQSIRDVYLKQLKDSALYIGLFWNLYGEYTVDEFDRASEWGIERHIYVKDVEADKRDPQLKDFLNKHGSVTDGITAKWFKTTDELCEAVKQTLDKWMKEYLRGPRGDTSARLYRNAGEILERPKKLIGRDDLLQDIKRLFEQGQQVLLQGFSGSGKSALAAEIAAGHCPALWLRTGRNDADELFEGLAREFNAQEAISKASGDEKVRVMRSLLAQSGIRLLVLDDVWNGQALQTLVKAVPPSVHLLVTSRRRYGIDSIVEVGDLPPKSATELLGFHANQDYSSHAQARELCQVLGHLAFAIRIAGLTLKMNVWNPAELAQKIQDVPHELSTPLDFIEIGRENVAKLIQVSLNALDAEVRAVFVAIGAFFAPQMTAEMVMRFFEGTPEVSDEMIAEARTRLPADRAATDDQIRQALQLIASQNIDTAQIEKHLATLVQHGLVARVGTPTPALPRVQGREADVPAYRLHDLAYSYARAQNSDEQRGRALDACLAYVARYNEPNLANFAALRPELDNMLNAASWAFEVGRYVAVEEITLGLYSRSKVLFMQGFFTQSTRLLEQAFRAAEQLGNKHSQGAHLNNLGTAHNSLGQVRQAISYYRQALTIAQDICDLEGEGNTVGNLGAACISLRQIDSGIGYLRQALAIAQKMGNKQLEASSLEKLGTAYSELGRYAQGMWYYVDALAIAREIDNKQLEAILLSNIGTSYTYLNHLDKALEYFHQSYPISQEIGDHIGAAIDLQNLGSLYGRQGDDAAALEHFQQARVIFAEIGAQHYVATVDANIARARELMGGG